MGPRNLFKSFVSLLLAATLAGGMLAEAVAEEGHSLSQSDDLAGLAQQAREDGIPILLMFSEPHCDYCQRLESEVLAPMKKWETDPRQAIIGKIDVGAGELLRNFSGQTVSADVLADAYDIEVFPTLVLVDSHGKTLVPKIIGYQTPEFYSAYLDAAIAVSQQLLTMVPANDGQMNNGK